MKRSGLAMPAALAAIVILCGVAALAHATAVASLREAAAAAGDAQAQAARSSMRARAAVAIGRLPRSSLVAGSHSLGSGDTALVVAPLVWPWHRIAVTVGGTPEVAEFGRATDVRLPACAAAIVAGVVDVAPGALGAGVDACGQALASVALTDLVALDSAVLDGTLPRPDADSLVLAGLDSVPRIWRASHVVTVAATASVRGLVMAPVVKIAPGAYLRGVVVARDSLVVASGAVVTGDALAAASALAANAAVQIVGRRGLLLPP